jgi:hypothetical protein
MGTQGYLSFLSTIFRKGKHMSFDIRADNYSKAAESGYKFELKLPTGAGSGAFLTIIGDQSPAVRNYSKRKFQEYQQKIQVAKRRGRDPEDMTLDEAEEASVDAALVRLLDWEGITEDGKPVKFSKEKAAEILKEHSWIREQVISEAGDVLNFTPKNSKV